MTPRLTSRLLSITSRAARTHRTSPRQSGSRRPGQHVRQGWNSMREQIFANQKRLGVIPANTQLTPWPDGQPEYGGAKLPKWETLSPDEKKLFARQAEVFAAYAAYTDHEIGRVIQAVEDMGKLDNTLIIYISGDNGTSAEGSTLGTPFDMAAIEGVNIPVTEQLKYLRRLGFGQDHAAHGGGVVLGLRHAVQMDQAGRVALRRHPAGPGHLMARPHQGRRRHPHPVPPPDRHRADDPRSHGHSGAGDGRWRCSEANRRREHGLHLRQSQRQRPVHAHDAIFRDGRQPRHLPRRLDCRHHATPGALVWAWARCPTWSTATNGSFTTSPRTTRRTTTSPPRCRTSCATCRSSSWSRRRNTTCSRWTIAFSTRAAYAATEPHRRQDHLYLLG